MPDVCPARLNDRVKYITEVWVGTFEDYYTRHFVLRLSVNRLSDNLVAVSSNFMVAYTTMKGRSEVLVAGTYEDMVAQIEEGSPGYDGASALSRLPRLIGT